MRKQKKLLDLIVFQCFVFKDTDEYAIFDRDGHVLQYREPLIARGPDGRRPLGIAATGPDQPIPLGLMLITSYRSDAAWQPRSVSAADAIVAMVEHAIPARDRPAETLATLNRALSGASALAGERAEADATAAAVIQLAEALWGARA